MPDLDTPPLGVILTGGRATRLRPLSDGMPKSLIPLLNRPLIAYSLDLLHDAGLREVVVVVGAQDDRTGPAAIAAAPAGMTVHVAVQEEPRGSGPWTNPYADEPRVATTPHLGAATLDAQPRIARRVAQTVRAFSRTGAIRDCVLRPRLTLGLSDLAPGNALLAVIHSTVRGSRKAVQDAIFEAGASNLSTVHQDFESLGVAYDLLALDKPLTVAQLRDFTAHAADLTGDVNTIRALRQMIVE